MDNTPTPDAVALLDELFPNVPNRVLTAALAAFLERTVNHQYNPDEAAQRIADVIAT